MLFGGLLLAALVVFYLTGRPTAPPVVTPPPASSAPPVVPPGVPLPPVVPAPVEAPVAPQAAPSPATAPAVEMTLPEREIVERVHARIREFGYRFGGNPAGTNAEITKALDGGNAKGVRFLDAEDLRLNDAGELLDPWGTPYFFHQLSAHEMELRSAGPDQQMWTDDDQQVK